MVAASIFVTGWQQKHCYKVTAETHGHKVTAETLVQGDSKHQYIYWMTSETQSQGRIAEEKQGDN